MALPIAALAQVGGSALSNISQQSPVSGSYGQSFGRIGSRIQSGITAGIERAQAQRNWEQEMEMEKMRMALLLQQAGQLRDDRADKRMFRNAMLGVA